MFVASQADMLHLLRFIVFMFCVLFNCYHIHGDKEDYKSLCHSVDIRRDAVKILLGNAAVNRLSVKRVQRVIISHQRPRARLVKDRLLPPSCCLI